MGSSGVTTVVQSCRTRTKTLALAAVVGGAIFLLYHFRGEHASTLRSHFFGVASPFLAHDTLAEPTLVEHGLDARLVWNGGKIPETRILRRAPGENNILQACVAG
jgi:hypothetical protein